MRTDCSYLKCKNKKIVSIWSRVKSGFIFDGIFFSSIHIFISCNLFLEKHELFTWYLYTVFCSEGSVFERFWWFSGKQDPTNVTNNHTSNRFDTRCLTNTFHFSF